MLQRLLRGGEVRPRLVALGDPHLHEKDFPVYLPIWDQMIEEVAVEQPTAILIPGDGIGGHDTSHVTTLDERVELAPRFRRLSDIAPLVYVKGNHDNDRELKWLPSCRGAHPIHVVSTPDTVAVGGFLFACLPYPARGQVRRTMSDSDERAVLEREMHRHLVRFGATFRVAKKMKHPPVCVVATHVGWHGAKPGGGEIWMPGGDPTVSPQDLRETGAHLVVGGHIHRPQTVWQGGYLLGSSRFLGHGEGGEDRFWWSFTYNSDFDCTLKRTKINCPRYRTVRVKWGAEQKAGDEPEVLEGVDVYNPQTDYPVELRFIVESDTQSSNDIPWDYLLHALDYITDNGGRITTSVKVPVPQPEPRAVEIMTAQTPYEQLKIWAQSTGREHRVYRHHLVRFLDDPSVDRLVPGDSVPKSMRPMVNAALSEGTDAN